MRVPIGLSHYYEPVQRNQAAASKMLLSLPSRRLARATTPMASSGGALHRGQFCSVRRVDLDGACGRSKNRLNGKSCRTTEFP